MAPQPGRLRGRGGRRPLRRCAWAWPAAWRTTATSGARGTARSRCALQPHERLVLRGAASTGFRAPSLGQSFFSTVSTNFTLVGGTFVPLEVVTAPVASELARTLGAEDLKPEQSVNLSAGLVWNAARNLDLTWTSSRSASTTASSSRATSGRRPGRAAPASSARAARATSPTRWTRGPRESTSSRATTTPWPSWATSACSSPTTGPRPTSCASRPRRRSWPRSWTRASSRTSSSTTPR